MKINLKNIKSFIEGNYFYYYNKVLGLPDHIQEQVFYRLSKCEKDCIPNDECIYCGCPPKKKAFVTESCNESERFPDLMNEEDWTKYKIDNEIKIDE